MVRDYGPERLGGQGLDPNQFESGNRAILALLDEAPAKNEVDIVATWREGAYEVWSRRGMVRFKRYLDRDGRLAFRIVEQIAENPIGDQDPFAVSTIEEELAAAERSGNPTGDPNRAFFEPRALSHPHAYERIAQLFDSPRAPDLVVSPKAYAYGIQAGQHGALDVVQSRAPLVFSGPGVQPGTYRIAARQVDIAPTIARLMGFPTLDSLSAGDSEDCVRYLKRQDGRVLGDILAGGQATPRCVYMILMDGLSHSELVYQLAHETVEIPNLRRLIDRGAMLSHGSTVNFPSITWPSHSTILTGTWCGHHDIVGPTFHLRESGETIPVQGTLFKTEGWLNPEVETLYELFKRVNGDGAITASIHEPQGRGADHAAFERRLIADKERLKALTAELSEDVSPQWIADDKPAMHREEIVDVRGVAQVLHLFDQLGEKPPVFVAHEFVVTDGAGHDYGPHHDGLREALRVTDRRIGTLLAMLKRRGLFDSTLFVITSDHGMAAQRVELKANPTRQPERSGLKGVFAEPMIYLRDMAIECDRTRDLRNLRVRVTDNDLRRGGEAPAVERASVTLLGAGEQVLGRGTTGSDGSAAFATPAELGDDALRLRIEHPGFNPRLVRADGTPIVPDLRRALYGSRASS